MSRRILLLAVLGTLCTAANAQYANIEGRFRSPITTLDLIALDSETGVVAASTTVVVGACSGSIAGVGKMAGNELKFSPYVKESKDDACVIRVVFDKNRNSARITSEKCTSYSGAACGWEGDQIKRAK